MEGLEEVKWNGTTYKPIEDKNRKFRFTCDKCGTCCVDNQIMLNPYDLMRLSRNKNMPISELIKNYFSMHIGSDSKLPILMVKMLPQCAFIDTKTALCSVYKDRPLVCRSYPVGRMVKLGKKGKPVELWLLNKNCSKVSLRSQKVWSIKDWIEHQKVQEYYDVTNIWHDFLTDICALKKEVRKGEKWQKNFFVRVYLGYDALKESGINTKGVPDRIILNSILESAKENLIPKK